MAGSKSDYLENKLLDHWLGNTAFTAPATVYVALYTAAPSDAGSGTEVTGGSYARVSVTNNTTNWPAASSGSKSNGTAISFPTASAGWGTVEAAALMDASTSGNQLAWAELLTGTAYVATAKASTDTFTAVGHALVNTDTVRVTAIPGSTSGLPTGISERTTYYVVSAATDTFSLSTSSGGAAVNLTANGDCVVQKTNFKVVSSGDSPSFAIGALTFSED